MNLFFLCCLVFFTLLGFIYLYSHNLQIIYSNSSFQLLKIKKYDLIIFGLIISLCLLSATRLNFFDTGAYKNIFYSVSTYSFRDCLNDPNIEVGFCLFTKLISLVTKDYQIYFFIITFINSIVMLKAFNNLKIHPLLGFLVYVCTLSLYYNLIVLRQGMAISLLFLGYSYLKKSKKFLCITFFVLAIFFHKSSVFIIILFLICNYLKLTRKTLILLSIMSLLVYCSGKFNLLESIESLFSYLPPYFSKYYYYFITEAESEGISILYICIYVFNFIYLILYKKNRIDEINDIIISYFAFSLVSSSPVMVRIIHFFNMFYIFLFNKNNKYSSILVTLFCLLNFLFYIRFILAETVLF